MKKLVVSICCTKSEHEYKGAYESVFFYISHRDYSLGLESTAIITSDIKYGYIFATMCT